MSALAGTAALLAWFLASGSAGAKVEPSQPAAGDLVNGKRLIGATAIITEKQSGLPFLARVDTGAESTSLHVEEWTIEKESKDRKKNIGKTIRFRVANRNDGDAWLTGKVAGTVRVKTSEQHESRYKVALTLRVGDFEKECLVTINNRAHMSYPALLGRNFLHSDFLVDVSLDEAVEHEPVEMIDGEEVETHDEMEEHEESAQG